ADLRSSRLHRRRGGPLPEGTAGRHVAAAVNALRAFTPRFASQTLGPATCFHTPIRALRESPPDSGGCARFPRFQNALRAFTPRFASQTLGPATCFHTPIRALRESPPDSGGCARFPRFQNALRAFTP